MRICLFTPTFLPRVGGTEYVTDALARHLTAAGHHAVVLAKGPPKTLDTPYPVAWYRRPKLPRWFPERTARSLRRLHAEHRFDLFVVNYATPTGYGAVRLGRRLGVPVVLISHGGDLYRSTVDRTRPHTWRRVVHAYRHADGIVAISAYVEQLIREINPAPPHLARIPNGIDADALARPAERPADFTERRPFCLCLGNLGPMKGFDTAIEAYARARDRLGGMAMAIAGSGKLEDSLRQLARDRGVESDVLFLGRRTGDDKRWLLQNAEFGLMPSIEEGHPIVALEFLACGTPLICSTNAAFDGVCDEQNSLRVPHSQPDPLADAMRQMAETDREAMGAVSRARAREYDWPVILGRYEQLFRELVATPEPDREATQRAGSDAGAGNAAG